jgi:hypothetical protein
MAGSMRIVVAGSGHPQLVFEAGMGMAASMWGGYSPLEGGLADPA